jgi:hypothetical protein
MLGLPSDDTELSNLEAEKIDHRLAHEFDLEAPDVLDWPITAARIVKIAKSLG